MVMCVLSLIEHEAKKIKYAEMSHIIEGRAAKERERNCENYSRLSAKVIRQILEIVKLHKWKTHYTIWIGCCL
jgi:hypothetical protein